MNVEEFLEHHGVLGMKWGVRRDRGGRSVSSPKAAASKPNGKPAWQSPPSRKAPPIPPKVARARILKSKKNAKILSEEATQIRDIHIKAKKHGVGSLTNKELETINKRIELQAKYKKAYPKKQHPLATAASLVIDAVLTDSGEKHLAEFLGPRSPDSMVMVRNALMLSRVARPKK